MKNPYKLYYSKYSTHYFILNNIGINKKVLDIGCNDGYIGKLSDKSNEFYGIDYLEDAVKKASKHYKSAIVYDLNKITPLPWKIKFDVIIFGDTLEHLLYPDRTLKFFATEYLQNNGKVIISFPNIASWRMRLKLLSGDFTYTDTGVLDRTHLHFYTFKTAHGLVNSAGLRINKEFGSSKLFGGMLKILPNLKTILGNNIILICSKQL